MCQGRANEIEGLARAQALGEDAQRLGQELCPAGDKGSEFADSDSGVRVVDMAGLRLAEQQAGAGLQGGA
jgi:hypothetical protein